MKTITYEGDGLTVTIELSKPTVSTALAADVIKQLLLVSALTPFAQQQVEMFSDVIRHTRRVTGLSLVLPSWNSNITDYMAVWRAWQELDADLGDLWIDAMLSIRDGASPLANRSDLTISESSAKLQLNLQKTEPSQAPSPTNN